LGQQQCSHRHNTKGEKEKQRNPFGAFEQFYNGDLLNKKNSRPYALFTDDDSDDHPGPASKTTDAFAGQNLLDFLLGS
jgi:hypothetical protein